MQYNASQLHHPAPRVYARQHRGRRLWRAAAISLVATLITFAGGCASYRSTDETGGRTFGEVTDDVAIKTAVKRKLLGDAEVKGWPISVKVHRGVVTLYGRTGSETLRARAVRIAAGVRGVDAVRDRLTIIPDAAAAADADPQVAPPTGS